MNNLIKLLFLLSFIQLSLQATFTSGNYFFTTKYFRGNLTYQFISNSGEILLTKVKYPFSSASLFVDPNSYFRLGNQSGDTLLWKPDQDMRICVYVKQAAWGAGYVRFERQDPNFLNDPNCGWVVKLASTAASGGYTLMNRELKCYLAFKISDFGKKNTQPMCALRHNTSTTKYSFNWQLSAIAV